MTYLGLRSSMKDFLVLFFLGLGLASCAAHSAPQTGPKPAEVAAQIESVTHPSTSTESVLATYPNLATHAEASGWTDLTPHEEVAAFYLRLAAATPDARIAEIGHSRDGRPLQEVVLARPSISEPWEAHASGKPILLIGAQVHGDEPAGKEGLMLFARDLAVGELRGLLDHLVVVLVPQINPDGAEGGSWGTRRNAAGYDLNRDYLRLVNPETQAVASAVVRWRPHVVVDAHECIGPPRIYDFYTLSPRNVNGPTSVSRFAAQRAIPAIEKALAMQGYSHIVYHEWGGAADRFEEGFAVGGFGARNLTNYGGALGAVSLLFESLRERDARVAIQDRARRHRIAMEALARFVAENRDEVLGAVEAGRQEMATLGARWDPADSIAIRTRTEMSRVIPYRVMRMERTEGALQPTGEILELEIPVADSVVVTLGRVRPVGYAVAASYPEIAAHLRAHGLVVERLRQPALVALETFRIDSAETEDPSEGYIPWKIQVTVEERQMELPPGTFLLRASQPNAALLFELLEPDGPRSMAATGWLNMVVGSRNVLPIYRLREWPAAAALVVR